MDADAARREKPLRDRDCDPGTPPCVGDSVAAASVPRPLLRSARPRRPRCPPSPRRFLATAFTDPEKARAAGKKGAEARRRNLLATKKPQERIDQVMIDFLTVREKAMRFFLTLDDKDPRILETGKLILDTGSRIYDRTAGKPAAARPQESGDPDDYRRVLEAFQPSSALPATSEEAE